MAGYLYVLPGLNYDHTLIMADVYMCYVLFMPVYTYSYTA